MHMYIFLSIFLFLIVAKFHNSTVVKENHALISATGSEAFFRKAQIDFVLVLIDAAIGSPSLAMYLNQIVLRVCEMRKKMRGIESPSAAEYSLTEPWAPDPFRQR